jgi:hypothetical protein
MIIAGRRHCSFSIEFLSWPIGTWFRADRLKPMSDKAFKAILALK